MAPKYSLIIPHIREGFFTDIAFHSLYKYGKFDDFEIIIVDNGETNSKNFDFIQSHPFWEKTKLLEEKQWKHAHLKNIGAKHATGEYFIFLNAHVYFDHDFLWELSHFLDSHPEVQILQPKLRNMTRKGMEKNICYIADFTFHQESYIPENGEVQKDIYEVPSMWRGPIIMHRSIWEQVGGFHPYFLFEWLENAEFVMRAGLMGYSSFFTPKLSLVHHFDTVYDPPTLAHDEVHAKLLFVLTDFSPGSILQKSFLHHLEKTYDSFRTVYEEIQNDRNIQEYREHVKKTFIHDEFWYFQKFYFYLWDLLEQASEESYELL